ncbi:MAG: LysR family transcriptional regulator [Variovorax sp.]|nr:MAG: LysR family transcriptional regulator [Variovorax sp.]
MNITLRQLRYFVEVAQSRSFSRAAEHLLIAQPALSQNIASLEEDLGAKLFKRHARGVELSPEGHRLLSAATEILARTSTLKEWIEGRDVLPSGPVRLSISGSVASVLIAPLLRSMAEQYPAIELTVREGLSFESRAQVESGQAHLALMPSPSELQGMESLPIFEERFMLFGAFAAMRRKPESLAFAEVADLPLAAPDGAHDLRKIIERAASAIDRRLDVQYELNSPPMLIAVVKEGLAYSIMPPSACLEAVAAKSIAGRQVVGPELSRVQAVVWPRDRPLTPAAVATRDTVVRIIGELVLDGRLHGRLIESSKKMKPK